MTEPGQNNIKFTPFISYLVIAMLMILNIVLGDVSAPPKLPDMSALKDTVIYSMFFASALIQGIDLPANFMLSGIILVVILPWTILALVFRKNILRIIISITIYALVLAGISWLLALLNIQPSLPGEDSLWRGIAIIINLPIGYIFYVMYLLLGDALFPMPLVILIGAFLRRYWKGKKAWHTFRSIIWGYLEVALVIMAISLFSSSLSGGILLTLLGQYAVGFMSKGLVVAVVSVSVIFYVKFAFKLKLSSLITSWKTKEDKAIIDTDSSDRKDVSMVLNLECLSVSDIAVSKEPPIQNDEVSEEDRQGLDNSIKLIEDQCERLELPLDHQENILGPTFHLVVYHIQNSGSLKQIKSQEEELKFRLGPIGIIPQIPLQDQSAVGFLVERKNKSMVLFNEGLSGILENPDGLIIYGGKNLQGNNHYFDLTEQPHLLVSGATGSGKSVFLHILIQSLIQGANRDKVRLVLIDPKRVEFSIYGNNAHLACPIMEDLPDIESCLEALVEEMENRYKILRNKGYRDIQSFNRSGNNPMSYIPVILDEVSDILLQDEGRIKKNIVLLGQKSRAVGIHLVLATQRPSADVIDGIIKANFPGRMAFRTSSAIDSRIILDSNGAEMLLGKGDCLLKENHRFVRLQAPNCEV